MQAVRVLVGVNGVQYRMHVDVAGEWQLHDEAAASRVRVETLHYVENGGLTRMLGKIDSNRLDANLCTVTVLAGDIGLGARILADENRSKSRAMSDRLKSSNAVPE
jgi:hypothetical protein